MPEFTLQNLTVTALPVYYLDAEDEQQSRVIDGRKYDTFFANELMPSTVKAIAKQKFRIVDEAVTPFTAPRLPNSTFGLSYVGLWGQRTHYRPGNVVYHSGAYYMVIKSVTGTTEPDADPTNYAKFAIEAPEQFFGIEASSMADGEGLFSDGLGGWTNNLIGDDNVDEISIAKVTSLQTSLNDLTPLSGGTMTGLLTLSGAPSTSLHAATKAYADLMLPLAGGTMTGDLTLSGAPTSGLHAATKTYVDGIGSGFMQTTGATMTGALVLSGSYAGANDAIDKTYADQKVAKSGDTLTGFITLHADPSSALHAATKQYVDAHVPLAGGTMTGLLTLSGAPTVDAHAATKLYTDTALNDKLSLTGGALTGAVTQSAAVTADTHLATKVYVDDLVTPITTDALYKAGGTMTGFIVLHQDPSTDMQAATKQYVDSVVDGNIGSGYVPASGGAMTGALTGSHGLLPLSGGTLTGGLTLANLTEGSAGLYEVGITDTLFYGDKRVLTEVADPITVTGSYTATADDYLILVDNTTVAVITLPSPDGFYSDVQIEKISEDPTNTVYVAVDTVVGETSESILEVQGQSVTFKPSSSGWRIIDNYTPSVTDHYITWTDPVVVVNDIEVGGDVQVRTLTANAFTGVTDEGGGLIGLTMASTTGFVAGNELVVRGTTSYNGNYLIDSVTASEVKVAATYVATETGHASQYTYANAAETVTFLFNISSIATPLSGYGGDYSVVATIGTIDDVLIADESLLRVTTNATGDFNLAITDDTSDDPNNILGYVHALADTGASISPSEHSVVTSITNFTAPFLSVSKSGATQTASTVTPITGTETGVSVTDATVDGGGVWISMADVSDYRAGMVAEVSNSTSYNGSQDVLEVDGPGDRIRVDVTYVANETCDVYSDWRVRTVSAVSESLTAGNVVLALNDEGSVLVASDSIKVVGTTSYDGTYTVVAVDDTSVEVTATWAGTETGEVIYDSEAAVFTVADVSSYTVGDPVTITGSGSGYDADYDILAIEGLTMILDAVYTADDTTSLIENMSTIITLSSSVSNRYADGEAVDVTYDAIGGGGACSVQEIVSATQVRVDLRFTATDTGDLDTNFAAVLTLLDSTMTEVNDLVRVQNVAALGGEVLSVVLAVDGPSDTIDIRAPYDSGEDDTGYIEIATAKPLHLNQL